MKKSIYPTTILTTLFSFLTFCGTAQWAVNTSSETQANGIYNTNTGTVGISNGTPFIASEKLQIKGGNLLMDYAGQGTTGNIYFGGKTDANQSGLRLSHVKNGNSYIDVRTGPGNAGASNGLIFRLNNLTSGNTERMRITDDGKVGIGTSSPLQTLDVNGRINLRNGVIQRGGAAITTISDLGLYSLDNAIPMRFVTNKAPFIFFTDGGTTPSGGTPSFTIGVNGAVGIGTNTAEGRLQIGSGLTKVVIGEAYGQGLYGGGYVGFNASRQSTASWSTASDGAHDGAAIIYADVLGNLIFSAIKSTGTSGQSGITDVTVFNNTTLFVGANGEIGINTRNTAGYKLAVNGYIRAKSIKVEPNWSDFVFEEDYKLPTLREVELYIKENGHLPEIPSAGEVAHNGIDVGEMNAKLLQKIEELTLYVIDLQKQIDELKSKK